MVRSEESVFLPGGSHCQGWAIPATAGSKLLKHWPNVTVLVIDEFKETLLVNVTVLGGGSSAQTLAADLAIYGWAVTLFDFPAFRERLDYIASTGQIEKYGSADTRRRTGLGKLKRVTFDMKEAVSGADLVAIAVPAYAHEAFFDELVKFVQDGQTVFITPGNWGALRFRQLIDARRPANKVRVAETDICFGPTRAGEPFVGPGRVRVIIERATIKLAAIPGRDADVVLQLLKGPYPELRAVDSVLETSIGNTNPATHAPLMLMNTGWLEHTEGQFMIYRDGATRSVTRAMDTLATERDSVARAFGIDLPRTTYDAYSRLTGSKWVRDPCEVGPPSLHHRYILEDVPYGLTPLSALAALAAVPVPLTDAMITLASNATETDLRAGGLSLSKLGLCGLAAADVCRIAKAGAGWNSR
jgi:opine dehydrogenase